MMPVPTPAIEARILQIRDWIASADRQGVARSDMQLHLSDRDRSGLTRSARVRVEEISFTDGVMRFLGVEVAAATAAASSLATRAPV